MNMIVDAIEEYLKYAKRMKYKKDVLFYASDIDYDGWVRVKTRGKNEQEYAVHINYDKSGKKEADSEIVFPVYLAPGFNDQAFRAILQHELSKGVGAT